MVESGHLDPGTLIKVAMDLVNKVPAAVKDCGLVPAIVAFEGECNTAMEKTVNDVA